MPNKLKILKSIDSHKNIMIEVNEKGEEIKKIRETNEEGVISYWIYNPEIYKEKNGKIHATGGYLDFDEAVKVCERLNNLLKK